MTNQNKIPDARGESGSVASQGKSPSQVQIRRGGAGGNPSLKQSSPAVSQRLPNASIVYGIGASILFVLALGLLFSGVWLSFVLVLLPAACLLGFAIHYIRVDSSNDKPYG